MANKANKYKERSKKYFDDRSENFFDTWDGKFCILMYENVMKKIGEKPFRSVLDVGCGTGAMLSMMINEYKDAEVYGIDFSEKMIEKASGFLGRKARLTVGDSDSLPWPDEFFDLVVSNSSFHHFPEPVKALNEMRRVLIPGGRVIIADPWWNRTKRYFINLFLDSPFNYLGDVRIYSETEMRELLEECRFESISWEIVDKKYSMAAALAKN